MAGPLFDRDLSWLEFNRRVLGEAGDATVPLLERLKFLGICASNLDEFFMVRVGQLRDVAAAERDREKTRWNDLLLRVRAGADALLADCHRCLLDELLPALRTQRLRIGTVEDLEPADRAKLEKKFILDLEPLLTPLAIEPDGPLPHIQNACLHVALELENARAERRFAIVRVPDQMPRLLRVRGWGRVFLEGAISQFAGGLFPTLRLLRGIPFRVLRNADLTLPDSDEPDLLLSVESSLRRREQHPIIWAEIGAEADEPFVQWLTTLLRIAPSDVSRAAAPLKLGDLLQLHEKLDRPDLKDPPHRPRRRIARKTDLFARLRRGDVLLHRPYDSFATVVDFIRQAAKDPDVVAIKQTLYRTDEGSRIVESLAGAASRGKQVSAVVELQARFEERKNIRWARQLEKAGVQVVFGRPALKTHAKVCLVIRREENELRSYAHFSTGNYNAVTSRVYTDLDLFTADADLCADAAQLMNLLTGFGPTGILDLTREGSEQPAWRRLVVAPMDYHRWLVTMIEREISFARQGRPARIVARANSLAEADVIEALYDASRAGVSIDLIIRGICSLVPGVPGVSDNITVRSIIDRFLEHSRVFRFENGGAPEIYISSGDWLPRNFFKRVETTFPVLDPEVLRRIEQEILPIALADNVKAWTLLSDGSYVRTSRTDPAVRSQEVFIARAEAFAAEAHVERKKKRKKKKKKKQKTKDE